MEIGKQIFYNKCDTRMPLSDKEIQLLIAKLRTKYADYAKKFSRVWFNSAAFEDRLRMAVENRMSLEGFILAEIANFEKVKEKYEKKKNEKSFSSRVDDIMAENEARIKQYPSIYFHPAASLEMVHCYGALHDYAMYEYPILRLVVADPDIKNRLNEFDEKLTFLALPLGKKFPKRILDHILVLSRPPSPTRDLEIEKDKNVYLKESAFLLNDIVSMCDRLFEMRLPEWETPLRFDRLFIEGERKTKIIQRYSGFTGYGAMLKVRDDAAHILEDFRLTAFKRKTPTAF